MRIGIIGLGSMGKAILKGWQKDPDIHVVGIHPRLAGTTDLDISILADISLLKEPLDVLLLAVKPQKLIEVLPPLKQWLIEQEKGPLICTVAAAKTIAFYQDMLGDIALVRLMPNLPVAYGEGIIGIYAEALIHSHRHILETILTPLGKTVWVKAEDQLDALTLLTGSGPAYVCLFMESLIQTACRLGFSETEAQNLIQQLIEGTVHALEHVSPQTYRAQVTSHQGTTAAAIAVLENNQFQKIIEQALQAGLARLKELI